MVKLAASNTDKIVGKRIQLRRKEMDLTVAQLSEKINLSPQQLARYERGENKINFDHFVKIAEHLKTPISWFFIDFDTYLNGSVLNNKIGEQQQSYETKYTDKQHNDLDVRLLQHWRQLSIEQKRAFILFLDTLK
ncbi:Transcriptional regulator, contains XRE-family HTH domain [Gilliamella bombicola]|uniref:Transcriptional regulator, contains XRE-family HTH domain n=1 Tax=Gilliamella bombicola TaxID=1798182 RepID=A0A1C4AN53_9GAMM|nr:MULTISPECIES: helix-turn-helix transcriptional regulator [Gilliamella]NUF26626.1 helix-turn-helix transcriptional regulator [Gilliamella sp. ESL0254]SCB96082.1 Transcriptional regulator, contains XRE-family HTH domain [Gilliamella bombicola]